MDTQYLKEFVTLANWSKLSRAAQELYISPSTLSEHISSLENELGCKLFTRTANGCIITKKGEVALEHARKILFDYDTMLKECSENFEDKHVRLSIPNYYYCRQPIVDARDTFLSSHPNCKVTFSANEQQGNDPIEALGSGATDVFMLYIVRGCGWTAQEKIPSEIHFFKLKPQRCMFVVSKRNPLANREVLTAEAINGTSTILMLSPLCSIFLDSLTTVLRQYGVTLQVLCRKETYLADLVEDDLGSASFICIEALVEESASALSEAIALPFEHELVADSYLLYRPDLLSDLQLEYIKTVETLFAIE